MSTRALGLRKQGKLETRMKVEEREQLAQTFQGHDAMNAVQRFVKRGLDVVGSLLGLVLLSPLFMWVAYKLKRQGDGPIIFSQERIGYKGKPFNIYKFRTMHLDAENGGPRLAMQGDDRLTPVGRFLREHHLDELPQLWNVLKGDMSMVGHRPERRCFIEQIMEHDTRYVYMYKMRPGLTSEATLYNGYTDTMEKMLDRLQMDLEYLETRSLRKDMKIIWLTAFSIVNGTKF
jgi:lipopolysaccharide/colanic/teichoic acid biosynthesis glycosyltransferase